MDRKQTKQDLKRELSQLNRKHASIRHNLVDIAHDAVFSMSDENVVYLAQSIDAQFGLFDGQFDLVTIEDLVSSGADADTVAAAIFDSGATSYSDTIRRSTSWSYSFELATFEDLAQDARNWYDERKPITQGMH